MEQSGTRLPHTLVHHVGYRPSQSGQASEPIQTPPTGVAIEAVLFTSRQGEFVSRGSFYERSGPSHGPCDSRVRDIAPRARDLKHGVRDLLRSELERRLEANQRATMIVGPADALSRRQ